MAPSSPNSAPEDSEATSASSNPVSTDAPASPAPARLDVGADAAVVLAALGRLQNAIHDERAVLAKLRARLVEMAEALGRAKATAAPETAALFAQFEFRVDAMIAIADGEAPRRPEAARLVPRAVATVQAEPAAAEPDRVPTVSGVVSRLGPEEEKARPAEAEVSVPADHSSNVAMLTAMVEALRDSIVAAAPLVETKPPDIPETMASPTGYPISALPDRPTTPQTAAVAPAPTPAPEPESEMAAEPKPAPEPAPAAPRPDPVLRTRISATLLPDPEFVIAPVEPAAVPPPAQAVRAKPAPPPMPDPLHALKAMTENERIALFS